MKKEREIKFKATITGTDSWIFGLPHSVYGNGIDSIQNDTNGNIEYINVDTLCQYIGLPFNIFEGDIIKPKNRDSIFVALWNEHNCCFSAFSKYEYREIISGDALSKLNTLANKGNIRRDWILEYEIVPIGNIYENPELLVNKI